MSRRSRRERHPPPARPESAPTPPEPAPSGRPRSGLAAQLALAIGVFALTTVIAELAGAANLGVALGIGQIAFAVTVVCLMVWR